MSRPYVKPFYDNSRDKELIIMHTSGVKPNLEFNLKSEALKYDPIVTVNGKKDPKLINIDWSPVIGYTSLKFLLTQALKNKNVKKTHVLLAGSPGTSKTVFLKTIETNLKNQDYNVHYLDSTTLTSSGVIEYLFTNNVEYLLLDELDKLEKVHQNTFLNLCESGLLQETKSRKIRKKDMSNCIIISTANYLNKIIEPLKTRFMVQKIDKYSKKEFYEIGLKLLISQYDKSKEIAYYIIDQIWNIYKVKRNEDPNLRYCVQVATLTDNTKETIDPILRAITDHSYNTNMEDKK